MARFATAFIAAAIPLAAAFAPAGLQARDNAIFFVAELAAPATQASAIAGGVVFRCEGTRCIAPRSGDRPLRVCSDLRREVGAIASFTAGDTALPEDRIARCNR